LPGNCFLVDPGMPVCSYALARSCDLVITFGSTIGIEAAGLGKPSFLMAPALYDYLESIIMVESASDLEGKILDMIRCGASGSATSLRDACMHFYSLSNIGEAHKYYRRIGLYERFAFMGVPTSANP
jgi:hypothetical protein